MRIAVPCPAIVLSLVICTVGLASCARISSILPDGKEPVCGPGIGRGAVRIVDLTAYGPGDERIAAAIERQVGPHRIMTDEPVWIPRRSAEGETSYAGSIATVQAIAGDWGCNLLVLLDSRMERTSVRTQSRNEDRVWLVLAGRTGTSG